MEALYFWLLIVAGVTMIAVGILLLTAERELGKQRRELERLRHDLRTSEAQGSATNPSAELLMTRDKELVEKISSLSSQLEESKRIVADLQSEQHQQVIDSELQQQLQASQETVKKLEAEQQRLAGVKFENQQLREEITTLRNQLQTSEIRLSESACRNQEAAEYYARFQAEIAGLNQQAGEGQAGAGELEAVCEQPGKVESREMIFREQQYNLDAQIEDLQRKLAIERAAVQELDATRERLAGMECVCQELREENRRLEDEISCWRQTAAVEATSIKDGLGEKNGNSIDLSSADSAASVHAKNEEAIAPSVLAPGNQKWRFGIIPVGGVVAITAAVAVGTLDTGPNKPSAAKEPTVAAESISTEQGISNTPISERSGDQVLWAASGRRKPAAVDTNNVGAVYESY